MKAQVIQHVERTTLEDLLGYHVRRASIRDCAGLAKALGDEVKMVPFTVLLMIDEAPGITAAEIGRALSLQRANLAPMLAEFDVRGFIERRPDRTDHRVQRLHLTSEGAMKLAEWRARVVAQENTTFGGLDDAERETLRHLLEKVWKKT